jgi:hypothetical protein
VKIRITADTKIPLVEKGKIFEVHAVAECEDRKTYFIHHLGSYLGIRDNQCEEIEESDNTEGGRTQ